MTAVYGPAVVRRRLGARLKELRDAKGLRLAQVATLLECSTSKLSRLETGQLTPKIRDVRDLLEVYGAPEDLRSTLMRWASDVKGPAWWEPISAIVPADLSLYISLETEALRVNMFSTQVPGLLQTREYAKMILAETAPQGSPDLLDQLVQIRVKRQEVLDVNREEVPPLQFHAIIDEAALHRGPVKGVLMRDQLNKLLECFEQENIHIQIYPFAQGYSESISTYAIFEPREPSDAVLVNVESTAQDAYFESASDVRMYQKYWSELAARAPTEDESFDFIKTFLLSM